MQAPESGKKSKRKRLIVLGVMALVLIGGFVLVPSGLGELRSSRAAEQTQTDNLVTVFRGDVSAEVSASGHVESAQETQLSVHTPGIVESVQVQVGDRVQAGDTMLQLKADDLILRVERAEQNLALSEANLEALLTGPKAADVASAESAVLSAQATLDELLAGPSDQDIAASEADLRAQQANAASASASYRSTLDSISDVAIAAARADLVEAQNAYDQARKANEEFSWVTTYDAMGKAAENLEIAQTAMDELLSGPNQGKVDSAAANVSAALASTDQAAANHERLLAGASELQIAAARANLAQAQANLASLTAGASAETITVAEAQIAQSRLALADAKEALARTTILAPFAGIVTDVFVAEGEYAVGDVVNLVSSNLKVLLKVDEVDIGELAVGQPGTVTMETWPNVDIAAEIISIAPSANVGLDGIVSFDVQLSLRETDLPVLVGMTADAHLITSNHENVILVPNAALTADRQAGSYSANLMIGEEDGERVVREVPVTIGLRDEGFTEIISGLSESDKVLIGELKAPTQSFGPFGGQ